MNPPATVAPVFADLVGQPDVAATLSAAAALAGGRAMTHAWLFTGPPGSGRSVAARAFAAALQCPSGGCGSCPTCRSVLADRHPDVDVVVPEGLHLSIAQTRSVVARSARAPSLGRWQVTVIEDVDRMEERTSNTLLRALEEPPPRAVFCLCAPSPEDLLPTIRSRCRQVGLRLPAQADIVEVLLRRDGIDPAVAEFAAQASGGHVGRALRLAKDPDARRRRNEVLGVPLLLSGVPAAVSAADLLVAAAEEEAAGFTAERDRVEREGLERALGVAGSRRPRGSAGALRELGDEQRSRATRAKRDALDRTLLDLAAFYRDVLARQLGAVELRSCPDAAAQVDRMAAACTPHESLRRIERVLDARAAIAANVSPQLAVTAMALELRSG